MTVAVATLRGAISDCQDVLSAPDVDRCLAALTEIEQQLADDGWWEANKQRSRARDAEAEVARLRDGVREIVAWGENFGVAATWLDDARALLAEDGAADDKEGDWVTKVAQQAHALQTEQPELWELIRDSVAEDDAS